MRISYTYKDKEAVLECEKPQVIIGRPREGVMVDLDLTPDRSVSRPHARIYVEGHETWIEDLNSMRGTKLNGDEIKGKGKWKLRTGDVIEVGETSLRMTLAVSAERPAQDDDRTRLIETHASGEPPAKTAEERTEITTTIAADQGVIASVANVHSHEAQRLELLYGLPLQFGEQTQLDVLFRAIVKRLVEVIPGARRGALLLQDRRSGELLLKAHQPEGEPAVSLSLARRAMEKKEGFLWCRGIDLSRSQTDLNMQSGMYAPLLWKGDALGVVSIDNADARNAFDVDDLKLLVAVARYAAMAVAQQQMHQELEQNSAILARLLTNFSPKIRDSLMEKARRGRLHLGGEKSEVTVLCSDIRGFTQISSSMDAEDIVEMLNDYFSCLIERIFKYDGTIDKFVGDAILAVFGSPEPDPQQQEKAVRAAMAMQDAMAELNQTRKARGQVTCEIGIGVHCGEVLHGFVGSRERMEFTVIGDPVNRAARYCDGARGGEVLISPEIHQRVWKLIQAESRLIQTKHEGDLAAFRIKAMKDSRIFEISG